MSQLYVNSPSASALGIVTTATSSAERGKGVVVMAEEDRVDTRI
jgi:hypothetical protein